MYSFIKSEAALLAGIATTVLFILFGHAWMADLGDPVRSFALFIWLFAVMLTLSFNVVRHADSLAVLLGEPYGTLILTLSVITIEVSMISAVMLTGENNPTLARDTMFSVLMIVLNGMLGLTLLIGGYKHNEQEFNLSGTNAYLGVITPLAVLGLVLPRFSSAPGGQPSKLLEIYLILVSTALYIVFILIQTRKYRKFFEQPLLPGVEAVAKRHGKLHGGLAVKNTGYHVVLLVATLVPIVLLSEEIAGLIEYGVSSLSAPQALGGLIVAILVLSPEGLSAIHAAWENQMQRTVNIVLGSALSTIGLTIPAVLFIALITGHTIELGLDYLEILLLLLSLFVSGLNFGTGRTNMLQGAVHLILFASYVVLMFD